MSNCDDLNFVSVEEQTSKKKNIQRVGWVDYFENNVCVQEIMLWGWTLIFTSTVSLEK